MIYNISVVIPVLNGVETILDAINSVLAQSYPIYEIIIVDNGSTDFTVDSVKGLNNPIIKIFNMPERGVSKARNHGLSVSSGDFVAFLDADDTWNFNKISEQINSTLHFNLENVGLIYSGCSEIKQVGKYSRCTLDDLVVGNIITTSGVLVNKKIILGNEKFFDEMSGFAEDWGAWISVALKWEIVFVNGAYVVYKLPPPNKYSWDKVSGGLLRIIEINEKKLVHENENKINKRNLRKIKHGVWHSLLLCSIREKKYRSISRGIVEILMNFSLRWYVIKFGKILKYEFN